MRTIKIVLGAMALCCGTALAADASLDAARRCVQITDSLQRLVCFDRAFAGTSAGPQAVAPPAPSRPAAVAVVPPPVPVVSAPRQLGDEQLKRSEKTRSDSSEPTSMTATVTAVRETRQSVYRMTLDNGQVWQQMDMQSLFNVKVGDTMEIERGRMGGYRMARAAGGSGWVRVTRVK